MPAGRPKKDNVTVELRLPRTLVEKAEEIHLDFKPILAEHFKNLMNAILLKEVSNERK